MYGTKRKYNYEALQVHHAIPINSNEDLKLDENNLITLCSLHHAMCDKGKIPYEKIKKIIDEQNKFWIIPHYPQYFLAKTLNTDSPTTFTPNLLNVNFLERRKLTEAINEGIESWLKLLESWLKCLTVLRNKCAHYSRLYFLKFSNYPKLPKNSVSQTNSRIFGLSFFEKNWNRIRREKAKIQSIMLILRIRHSPIKMI